MLKSAMYGLALSVLACAAATSPAFAAKIGKPAPEFTLTTIDGQVVTSDQLKGQVVVLNYWATWCGPCRNEMPMFDSYLRHHPDQGLRIFSITTEGSVSAKKLKPVADILSFPLVSRLKGGGYGTMDGQVPTSYVIDRSGVVRWARAGSFNLEAFDATIAPLLAEPTP